MRIEIILLIIGMCAVTYIPRAIPAIFINKLRVHPKIEAFLKLIPYTAMTALIFPGLFSADAAHPEMGILGGVTAGILAWRRAPLMVCVLAAIAVDIVLYLIFY